MRLMFQARFFCEAAPPFKTAKFKVTLCTSHSAVDLQTLFRRGNFNLPGNVTPTQAGFHLCNGDTVSVVAAKSSARCVRACSGSIARGRQSNAPHLAPPVRLNEGSIRVGKEEEF
jgi:hypothetical protein